MYLYQKSNKAMHIFQKLILLLLVSFVVNLSAQAQRVELQGYAQNTIVGLQKGYAIRLENNKGIKIGAFYQSTKNFSFEEGLENYPFTGMDISFPLVKCEKVNLVASTKVGLLNYQFAVLVPEIESYYKVNKYVQVGFGASVRAGQSAISFKTIFTPF